MNLRVLGAGANCPGGGNVRGDYVRWGNVEGECITLASTN